MARTTHDGASSASMDPNQRAGDPRTFPATLEPRRGGGVAVKVPFDPSEAWGDKDRHYVHGTIGGHGVRGVLSAVDGDPYLLLGPTWCRDPRVGPGAHATVVLGPEGPQFNALSPRPA